MVCRNNSLACFPRITSLPDSSLTIQLHILLTRTKMSGPRSVNLAKRDRLIDPTDAAKGLPTFVISLNPRTEQHVTFIENGANHRKVQWMTLWSEVIQWCLACARNAKSSNARITSLSARTMRFDMCLMISGTLHFNISPYDLNHSVLPHTLK